MMIVREALPDDARHVIFHMRESDRREVYAGRFNDDPHDLFQDFESMRAFGVALRTLASATGNPAPAEPVALVGVWSFRPGVGVINLIATSAWPRIAMAAHRYLARTYIPAMQKQFRRLECQPLATNTVTRAWLRRLGFEEEGVARVLGRDGEDFIHCARYAGNGAGNGKEVVSCV